MSECKDHKEVTRLLDEAERMAQTTHDSSDRQVSRKIERAQYLMRVMDHNGHALYGTECPDADQQ